MSAPTMHYGDMELEPSMQELHDAIVGTESAELVDVYEGDNGARCLWCVSDGDRSISIAVDESSAWNDKLKALAI